MAGYLIATMKTIGKRINRAFTIVQPLPAWPGTEIPRHGEVNGDRPDPRPIPTTAFKFTFDAPAAKTPAQTDAFRL